MCDMSRTVAGVESAKEKKQVKSERRLKRGWNDGAMQPLYDAQHCAVVRRSANFFFVWCVGTSHLEEGVKG
jgi:hypothetical protein